MVLSGIHFYWIFGGKKGLSVSVPELEGEKLFLPSRWATFVVALGLLIMACINLVGWKLGVLGIAVIFLLRSVGDFRYLGLFKKVRNTPFAQYDTQLYVPLCLLLTASHLFLLYLLR
jgi:hypothetical protein